MRDVTVGPPPTFYNGYACHTAVPPTSTTLQPPASEAQALTVLSAEEVEGVLGAWNEPDSSPDEMPNFGAAALSASGMIGPPMPLSVNQQHGYNFMPQQSAELHQMWKCGPDSDVTPDLQVVAPASSLAHRISLQVSPVSDTSQHESSVSPCGHSSSIAAASTSSDFLDVEDITIAHSGYSSSGSCGGGSPSALTVDSVERSPSYSDPCRISPTFTDQPVLDDRSVSVVWNENSNDFLDQLSSNHVTSPLQGINV